MSNTFDKLKYVCHLPIRTHVNVSTLRMELFGFHPCYHVFIDIECFRASSAEILNNVIFCYRRNQITLAIVRHWTLTIPMVFQIVYFLFCCMGKLCSSEYRCSTQQIYLQIYNFELMKILVIKLDPDETLNMNKG